MNQPVSAPPVEILLVEDNPGDVLLIRECMKDWKRRHTLRVAEDGVDAMAILRPDGGPVDTPLPDLILLDLNLPRTDGFEVLQEIKADAQLRHIPVVILTSSRSQKDILRSYTLQASCYVVKPLDLEEFAKVIGSIEIFWLTCVCFVSQERRVS